MIISFVHLGSNTPDTPWTHGAVTANSPENEIRTATGKIESNAVFVLIDIIVTSLQLKRSLRMAIYAAFVQL